MVQLRSLRLSEARPGGNRVEMVPQRPWLVAACMGLVLAVAVAACQQPESTGAATTSLDGGTTSTSFDGGVTSSTRAPGQQPQPSIRLDGQALLEEGRELYAGLGEYLRLVAACVREQGFDAEVTDDGFGIRYRFGSAANEEAGEAVVRVCEDQYEEYYVERRLTREEEYYKNLAVADCLRSEGYSIPPAPSLETWLDSYAEGPWIPYDYVFATGEEWARLNRLCPQL